MLKAVMAAVALMALAQPVLAQSVRPKPRPALFVAPPVAESAAANGAAEQQAEEAPPTATPASAPPTSMRPLGPPAPSPSAAPETPTRDPNKGAVTNLPLPRFVSLKSGEGNARRGPGLSHRIDWVFTRVGMPLKITAEHGHWRRVEDIEGAGGWVHYALLSGVRSVMVAGDMVDFYTRDTTSSQIAFRAERGVVARVIGCKDGWCRVFVDGQRGWTQTEHLWGVTANEVIE